MENLFEALSSYRVESTGSMEVNAMLRKKIVALLIVACVGVMTAGCGSPKSTWVEEPPTLNCTTESSEEEQVVADEQVEESEQEGLKTDNMTESLIKVDPMDLKTVYERAAFFADWVYVESKDNTIVSPMSLNIALGLAAEGASGETAKELYDYLGREDYSDFVKEYLDFAAGLEFGYDEENKDSRYTFRYEIANSLWINQQKRLNEAYRTEVEKKFRAEVAPVDFNVDINGTVERINAWCKDKTHDMIPEIITKRDIQPNLNAILVNSVYFESPWAEEWYTREGEFKDFGGETTALETLWGSATSYFENDQAIAFGKNYYNGFEFIGILPKQEGEFSILSLDIESLLNSRSKDYSVSAKMPKLDFATSASNVENILMSQGITKPFDADAQFDKIIEDEQLYISHIIQKCKIELDEKGTKAAAVTAITLRSNAIMVVEQEHKEVILDRPFAFMIYDSVNNEIVFIGKVTSV